MKGEINGLKTLIMKDSPLAYYIHYFAHQLQLTLVAIAKKHVEVEDFFYHVTNVLNVVGRSFKRRDLLHHHQVKNLKQLLESGEAHTEQGLNQECGLQRPGDTHWGLYFKTLDNFLVIFSSIIHVLGVIEIEGSTSSYRNQAEYLLTKVKTFKFVFMLHLMLKVLAMSNELTKILQKKNQDIVNVVEFLNISKKRLQDMRENEWESLLNDVSSFCDSHDILIPKLDEPYFPVKSSLILILPVATATVERAFSSMKHIRNEVRNSIGDQYLNDCLGCYIERDVFANVSNDVIVDRFQNMKTRCGQL
ncbi:uncharacterized protein LOC124888879 [Capsicum annuum]|uniref:uncharacterized protein LOC124888879 n=1 Tax=Capsicum annuum TaxID=4072 RepID=UPI001FB16D08|nr:uncharacterized protein LOC124888879 [Capsicum annuum]